VQSVKCSLPSYLHPVRYVNEGIYELEKSTVFAKNWVSVNGAHHLNKPGDFITGNSV